LTFKLCDDYIRKIIRMASNEVIDLKSYEADMRFLLDTYIRTEDSETITPFEDVSLLDLMGLDIEQAPEAIPASVRGNQEAVAEMMENNVRSKIVEAHLLDPKYFEHMSVLLKELIEARKRAIVSYQEYLRRMAELAKKVIAGKGDDIPKTINTPRKVALYHTLDGDEKLTLACEEAVQSAKQDGFRENKMKERKMISAIKNIVKDDKKVALVYQIIKTHKQDY
jgi:type I restriction enzyme R subunit